MTQKIPAWENGELIPLDKLEVHRRGLRHPAVSVFLLDGDRLLIQRRALGKYHTPGLWANTCCTHPVWGEAPDDCARRRLGEELGLTGVDLDPRGEVEYRAAVGADMIEHELVRLFAGSWAPEFEIRPDPAEVMDWRWVTLAALGAEIAETPDIFTPWLRVYLSRHSEAIFGTAA
jgi:isopentenyl-diphosphate delta-isomerase